MGIVEFAETMSNGNLPEWQKEYLKTLYDFQQHNPDKRIYINVRPYHGYDTFYTYFKEHVLRELTQSGTTPNSY